MYLSHLLIDVGCNPDRPRPGRLWLRNLYHVHQRLCMAFPSAERKSDDEEFLKPYAPDDFAVGQVHVTRGEEVGLLFRIDPQPSGSAVILVQSAREPNWKYAFHNARYLLAAEPDVREFEPRYEEGQRLQFRLLANPTRKIDTKTRPDGAKSNGKRVPCRDELLFDWLVRQGVSHGFAVDEHDVLIQTGYVYFDKEPWQHAEQKNSEERKRKAARLRSVRYDGVLTVAHPGELEKAIVEGIGSAKGFGFGLLSVLPLR